MLSVHLYRYKECLSEQGKYSQGLILVILTNHQPVLAKGSTRQREGAYNRMADYRNELAERRMENSAYGPTRHYYSSRAGAGRLVLSAQAQEGNQLHDMTLECSKLVKMALTCAATTQSDAMN